MPSFFADPFGDFIPMQRRLGQYRENGQLPAAKISIVSVEDAIVAAEAVLPGRPVSEGEMDPRWQAIIAVGEFTEAQPEPV